LTEGRGRGPKAFDENLRYQLNFSDYATESFTSLLCRHRERHEPKLHRESVGQGRGQAARYARADRASSIAFIEKIYGPPSPPRDLRQSATCGVMYGVRSPAYAPPTFVAVYECVTGKLHFSYEAASSRIACASRMDSSANPSSASQVRGAQEFAPWDREPEAPKTAAGARAGSPQTPVKKGRASKPNSRPTSRAPGAAAARNPAIPPPKR
jgi:hypothetical protein